MSPVRVLHFNNVLSPGLYQHRLIQGAQRWLRLSLSSPGSLVLSSVGFIPSVDSTPVSLLPGSFSCSDPRIDAVWAAGARTLQLTEIPAKSIPEYWIVSSEDGIFVDGLAPQPYYDPAAFFLMDYSLLFHVKPVKGGFGVMVLSNTLGEGIYIDIDAEQGQISAYSGWPTTYSVLATGIKMPLFLLFLNVLF